MPSIEKKVTESAQVEKTPDFAELQAEKEKLFNEIEQDSLNLDEHRKYLIVSKILGHSVKDGFEMAKRLGMDLAVPLMSGDFIDKNGKFAFDFSAFLTNNINYIPQKSDNDIYIGLTNTFLGTDRPINDMARDTTPYKDEIDDYYKEFIRNRRLISPDLPPDSRTKVEITAEDHLLSAEAILKGSYYTGPVREFLGLETEEALEKETKLSEENVWALRQSVIDSDTLAGIMHEMELSNNVNVEKFQSLLSRARYAPSKELFEIRKRGAEEELVTQIKKSLIKRGFKEGEFEIKMNEENGEYEVVEKKEEGSSGTEEKENLREVKEIPPKEKEDTKIAGKDVFFVSISPEDVSPANPEPGRYLYHMDFKRVLEDTMFGPYDEIKLCENSKDKLIFYAKKGDEHFVYVDGVESKLKLFEYLELKDIVVDGEGRVFLHFFNERVGNRFKHKIYSLNSAIKGNYDRDFSDIKDFSIINGKLLVFYSVSGEDYLMWDGTERKAIPLKTDKNNIIGFRDSVCISDVNRILIKKYGENEFKEMTFDGTVEVVNSDGRLFIIESLPDKKMIWEYSEKLELNEGEERDLDLANAVAKEELPAIEDYFKKYYPEEEKKPVAERIKSGIKSAVEQSRKFVGAVNRTIKEVPELFLDTLRAKDDKPTEFLMTQMFYYMFPEARVKRERALKEARENKKNPFNIFGGGGGSGQGGRGEVFDYDAGVNNLASVDEAGYYEMLRANREVLKLREPLPPATFITHGLFGNYTGSGWSKVNVPISQEVQDPAKETTFEFVDEKSSQNINLPKIANAKIITERLKGITADGKEVPVKIIEENNLGEVRVSKDPASLKLRRAGKPAKQIVYSQTYSEMPKTMAEVTTDDYEKFRESFEKSFGDVITKEIGDRGDELDIFIAGLKDKSPREQVIAIQEFCYEYGYYNLDNQPRDTDNFEERLSIMEFRMDELKSTKPELAHKKYAGICTDFATLTTALLRKAGFVSGIASGFVPEAGSTSVKTDRAHAVSYVLWPNPNKKGKPDMIIVDGTPSNITPRIVEQEKKAAEVSKELTIDAEKELAELERVLRTMDVEAIRRLENGALEKTLNHILYGVKQSHVDVMSRVLNASRYAGFDILEMSRGNIEDQIEFRKFLEEEIFKEKGQKHDNRERRGEELFNLMIEFERRFEKDRNVKGKEEALDVLEKIFDMSEKYLDPIETRSAVAIITYLRAMKMR